MKKGFLLILSCLIVLFAVGCEDIKEKEDRPEETSTRVLINEAYGYKLYYSEPEECNNIGEQILVADYVYYFECQESAYFTIEDSSENEYTIEMLLQLEFLTIQELYELFDGRLLKRDITIERNSRMSWNVKLSESEFVTTINDVDIYYAQNEQTLCDNEVKYLFKDIYFKSPTGCEHSFFAFGYFAIYNELPYTLEYLVYTHVISELDIVEFHKVEAVNKVPYDNEGLLDISLSYGYTSGSPYHESIIDELMEAVFKYDMPFSSWDWTDSYAAMNQTIERPMIPKLNVRINDQSYTFIGGEILGFIDAVSQGGSMDDVVSRFPVYIKNPFDRIGVIKQYSIIYKQDGPAMYMMKEVEYEGYYFLSGALYRPSYDEFYKIGLIAYFDYKFYYLTDLLDDGEIDIEDLIRFFPTVGTTSYFD